MDEAELLVAAGRCYRNANAHRDAWRRLLRAIDLYRDRENAVGMADATLEAMQVEAPPARLVALNNEVLGLLGDDEPEVEARLLGRGLAILGVGPQQRPEQHRLRASELAESHDLDDVRALLNFSAGLEANILRRREEGATLHLRAAQQFEALGLMRDSGMAQYLASTNLISSGQLDEARRVSEEGVAYARRYHLPYFEENLAASHAGPLLALCDFDALQIVLDEQADASSYMVSGIAAFWALQRGDLAAAREALPAVEVAGGIPVQVAVVHSVHARTLLLAGDADGASHHIAKMREAMDAAPQSIERAGVNLIVGVFLSAGESGLELAGSDVADAVLEELRGQDAAYMIPLGTSGRVIQGRYALATGELPEAHGHFAETLEWAEREGAYVIAGQCHQGLAEVAIRRGNTADAMEHLDAAMKLFEQYGAKLYLDQVIAKKLELQGVSPADAGPGAATIVAETPALDDTIPAE